MRGKGKFFRSQILSGTNSTSKEQTNMPHLKIASMIDTYPNGVLGLIWGYVLV